MRTIAITSGKGGVGKTNFSCNFGIELASLGQRVVLFDADLGLANLDVVLGVKAESTLQDILAGHIGLEQALSKGPLGVRFIAGGSGVESLMNLTGSQLERFLNELTTLASSTDVLIFDTGAGIDENVMTFLLASDEVFLVTTPDPASITDAYATATSLWQRNPAAKVKIMMNMVSTEAEARTVYARLSGICNQFLNKQPDFAGFVRFDPEAVHYIRKRVPFMIGDPNIRASKDIAAIAANFLGRPAERQPEALIERLRDLFSFKTKRSA